MSDQSIQSVILATAVAALPGAFRCRFRDFAPAELPGRNVVPESEDAEYSNTTDLDRTFQFTVRHHVAAVDGVDVVADQQYVLTSQQLNSSFPLWGNVHSLREVKKRWENERGELQQMTLSVTFEVQFSTSPSDPSIAGY